MRLATRQNQSRAQAPEEDSPAIKTWRFTVKDFERMLMMRRVESQSAACSMRLTALLCELFKNRVIVSPRGAIVLNEYSAPRPDFALLRFREDYYRDRLPKPPDVLLVVVESSVADFDDRCDLYARSGIMELWRVDLERNCIEAYFQPRIDMYTEKRTRMRGQRIVPQAFPDLEIEVNAVLG
jgi:Uma2 family endonuclease